MSEETAEKRETRSVGTAQARESIKEALDQAGLPSEGKLDLDDVALLIQQGMQAKEQAQALPSPDEIMMQTFIASGLDPAMLDTWRATAAEQQIPFAQFVMGHIVKAQMSGELNAPARDQGWAAAPAGSGGSMMQTMEYTCKSAACGKTEVGRLGQIYCSNQCAADDKKAMRAAAAREALEAQKQTMRERIMGLFGLGGRDIGQDGLAALSAMLGQQPEGDAFDRAVNKEVEAAKEDLGAVGVSVGEVMERHEAATGGREVFAVR